MGQRVIIQGASDAATIFRIGLALEGAGQVGRALAVYRQIADRGGDPVTMYQAGTRLLLHGDYEHGWRAYEGRAVPVTKGATGRPTLSFPEWRGEPVRSLLVVREQGLGDQIMFARYLPVLQASGIAVTLLCAPALVRLFCGLGFEVLPASGETAIPRRDAWALLPSLPYHLHTTLATIPPPIRLPSQGTGSGIGIMWRGNPDHDNDRHRSLPEAPGHELLGLPGAVSLHPADTGARDFEDTRQIIAGLERVISVDTSIAHLAGSMGKPVSILLPATGLDWRWGVSGERSPWYPSARLHRQLHPGDWRSVLDQLNPRSGTTR
jgi:hypothetical protein